jgi:hypothetical protein
MYGAVTPFTSIRLRDMVLRHRDCFTLSKNELEASTSVDCQRSQRRYIPEWVRAGTLVSRVQLVAGIQSVLTFPPEWNCRVVGGWGASPETSGYLL